MLGRGLYSVCAMYDQGRQLYNEVHHKHGYRLTKWLCHRQISIPRPHGIRNSKTYSWFHGTQHCSSLWKTIQITYYPRQQIGHFNYIAYINCFYCFIIWWIYFGNKLQKHTREVIWLMDANQFTTRKYRYQCFQLKHFCVYPTQMWSNQMKVLFIKHFLCLCCNLDAKIMPYNAINCATDEYNTYVIDHENIK